jgi:hypothetical protein
MAKALHDFCLRKGWPSPGEASIAKQLYRLETGRIKTPDEFYTGLYCEFFQKTAHELFGTIDAMPDPRVGYRLRSHKFIPAYVGVSAAESIRLAHAMEPAPGQWVECDHAYSDTAAERTLYIWPFGIVMYHIVEDLTPTSLAEVSVWRQISYRENIAWATENFTRLAGQSLTDEPYVLSTYWVESTPWDDMRRDTALRLLCMPRSLIERDDDSRTPSLAHATLVEQALLREGFDHPGIVDFGIKGISMGFASWSGVVYHPIASDRALREEEITRCELAVQAAWSYCNYLRLEVEAGRDPTVPAQFGWRFLRGLRSRLTTERPQETSQHRSMRDAIVETSGLSRHLSQAIETLREAAGGQSE